MMNASPPELDPDRFPSTDVVVRGTRLRVTHAGTGGVPLLAIHGWPESRRIWGRIVEPLVAAGFEVVAPDLRGFGDSEPGADGLGDHIAHALDMIELMEAFGHDRWVVMAGDLGGPVGVEAALRAPERVDRMVLFNSPLPRLPDPFPPGVDAEFVASLRDRPAPEAMDYFIRQGTDADALALELSTDEQRTKYVAQFYTDRGWAAPGAFSEDAAKFHAEPFGNREGFRATLRTYESVFDRSLRSDRARFAATADLPMLLLHGTSDGVVAPDFGALAALTFPDCVGPVMLEGCGHFVQWEAAPQLVEHSVAFCADLLDGFAASAASVES
jgi:hypothetical protein